MARQGIPAAIWFENDLHPVDPLNPVGSIAEQLGYNGDGQLLHTGLTWMMLKDPDVTPLVAEDLRFHFRFGMAQAYMLGTTFVQRFLENHFGPQSSTWTAAMKSVLAGGSKRGTATLTACGVDPRIRGARISGSQSFNADPLGAWARYVKDWGECPGGQLGERAEFTAWAEEHGDDLPSYYSVYAPDRCPEAYQNVFILDIVGTHDYINPLGSHSTFWQRRDGLTDGLPDPTEVSLRHACIRRENKSHGSESFIGTVGRFEISKSLVLLFRLVRHLALDKDLPTIDIVDLNVSDPVTWTARVRVTGQHPVNDEQLSVFLALSDDRDFRRCTPPIVSLPQNPCFEGVGDDNKEEEDKFVRITPTQVTVEGELRTLSFPAPVDVQAFSVTPIVAAFVELVLEGANPNRFGDDIWVDTEVLFRNDELYPELSCP
jgi:hypothetical protein